MKKVGLCLFALVFLLFFSEAQSATDDFENYSHGYRYRASFEINDPDMGKGMVYIFSNTWIFNGSKKGMVWVGNPHPDIKPQGSYSSVIISPCSTLFGKGIEVIRWSEKNTETFRRHDNITVVSSVPIYDFLEKRELGALECGEWK